MESCCTWWYIGIACVVVLLYALRKYFLGPKCKSKARLDGKVIVITGANTGIGKETAIDLAKRGATIVLACRDQKRGDAALKEIKKRSDSSLIFLKLLDLASLASVHEFVDSFLTEHQWLHILVNNAGIVSTPRVRTDDGFQMQFGVNHLGHFALTNLLLPRLKTSAPSRVINVTSRAHMFAKEFDFSKLHEVSSTPIAAYAQSKLANVLFTKELHRQVSKGGISTFAVHPGFVLTELDRNFALMKYLLYVLKTILGKTSYHGAQTTIYCAVEEGLERRSGMYFQDCHERTSSKLSYDKGVAKKLWECSEEMTKIKLR